MAKSTVETVTITRLGHLGDGIAETETGTVFVPFTLPGERVEIERTGDRGRPLKILETSPARTAPTCRHFGACGGCALQHMKPEAYLAWKREQLRVPLAQRGVEAPVAPVVPVSTGSRRRAVFAARRVGKQAVFGYHARHSHRIVAIEECPILRPEIANVLPGLAKLAGPLTPFKGEIRIGVTATDTGLDVAFEGPRPRPPALAPLAAPLLQQLGIARLSIAGEPVMTFAEPTVTVDGMQIALPPLAFLQAAASAETVMGRLVGDAVAGAGRIADLYAGIGTFALRLARQVRVLAVEGDGPALTALAEAARRARGVKPMETLKRDLARMPMSAGELSAFDAVVFDPPRAGADAQAREIAAANVAKVVAVSCNPATLARDLKTLVDGGYRVDRITPVDQFLYSPHIEAVAELSRDT
ncbi:class I SAM-dependent RNA methyltransferase [Microbaculum marinisediminis]|uniref:RNA methyltransferase n=1 Tax=Microbaculum marinisediminis TaxID=2931392 RepID=A0AAW5QVC9_9HYPH|nr:TRAM domain-containing protein [Microbaculum sp. A6E488]MCT8970249.1 RNA methyltransferase [Microbaculum sp. A6E488]